MKTNLLFLVLLLVPVLGHADTEKSISWKISGYSVAGDIICAHVDFHAEGMAPGTVLAARSVRCDGASSPEVSLVVSEDHWIEDFGGRFCLMLGTALGEPSYIIFREADGTEHVMTIVAFPMRFWDKHGHVVTLNFIDPNLEAWKVDIDGYTEGEELTIRSSSCGERMTDRMKAGECTLMLMSPAVVGRSQGTCKMSIHSQADGSNLLVKFGWGRKRIQRPTKKWLEQNHTAGLLQAPIFDVDSWDGYERTTDGLRKGFIEPTGEQAA